MLTGYQLLFILTMATLVYSYCPPNNIRSTDTCSFSIHCEGNIRGVRLPNACLEASNYPVNIDITLTDVIEAYEDKIDQDFLGYVTTLRITGRWPKTELDILHYTPRLRKLFLVQNKIESLNETAFYYMNSLDTIDLSRNRLTDIGELFQFESHPNRLKELLLAHNAIEEIPGDSFSELSSLIKLDLSHNRILNLNEEPFSNLTSLEILKLNNNNIKDLNGALNNLHKLKHLYLNGNQIQKIAMESLKIIIHLETFDMSRNELEQIQPIVFSRHWDHMSNHSFCKIILSNNHIISLPNTTSQNPPMFGRARHARSLGAVSTELDLSSNSISNIEYYAFRSLLELTSLDLSNNKLINFVVSSDDVTHVKYLNLSSNYLSRLYFESFSTMTDLQNLDLSYNQLYYIPEQTFNYNYNLKHVNMTFNDIEKLENLHIHIFHPDGGVLDLSNNGLCRLNIPLGEGLRLHVLVLHSNNITDPSEIDLVYQRDLKVLNMSSNHIRELHEYSLRLPINLVYLDLSNNLIQRMGPSSFYRVSHLKTLRLEHNQLRTIEYGAFRGLTSLLYLDLSHNMIGYLDSKLLLDLKYLGILSIMFNQMHKLQYESWFGHRSEVKVYMEGNNFTCEWLAIALKNYQNGYSMMKPVVSREVTEGHSVDGIPCTPEEIPANLAIFDNNIIDGKPNTVMADERLLVISQKILEAIREQNFFMRKYIWHSEVKDYENNKV